MPGGVPPIFLSTNALVQCRVCSRLLSARYGTACPRCKPALSQAGAPCAAGGEGSAEEDRERLAEIFGRRVITKKGVPRGAKQLWAQCVVQALSSAVDSNSVAAWIDLLTLPKATLRGSPRGGKGRKRAPL